MAIIFIDFNMTYVIVSIYLYSCNYKIFKSQISSKLIYHELISIKGLKLI